MSTRIASALLAALALTLSGCGFFDWEEREPWRAQAEAACFARGEVRLTSLIQEVDEIDGKGICGLDRPLKVAALADGSVRIGARSVVMSCPMTAALERWVKDVVLPASYERYGVPVIELKSFGTYNCRTRNNVPGARLSEHAFANAFDLAGVVLANGYVVTVKKGWRGSEADRAFLRQITAGACGPFTTVLGPGSDGVHEDHLHLDLARHNAKGTYRYCRPKPQVPPPASWPPVYQASPGSEVPVADLPPDLQQPWPRVLPQSIAAADAAPVPQAAPPVPAYPQTAAPAPGTLWDPTVQPPPAPVPNAPVPGCPPGYVCMPVQPGTPPPPVGWSVGPQPLQGYAPEDVTGTLGYTDE